ncbi:DNRLRE domain-containing protein [Croceimicrobium hydrocarbonivorans]|uniref:DNRLRE domain-containing protein n=1 Tax=Croceimicrobium hydrocarbonivorans TaxID=2761580 RepID=A0A7H0VGD4_9FLAO|nr:DNRLRE domain-containing protein [Croceimicrobium hydrocarbonivorans]QNR24782.1 DNRLRE domain-containing protein [Croceimicrobium hydrocarbonivorans]
MKKLTLFFLLCGYMLSAQTLIIDTLNTSKDAMIRKLGNTPDPLNYGSYPWENMHAWTNNGQAVVHRSLIDFNLNGISNPSLIDSAFLVLQVPPSGVQYSSGHHMATDNSCEVTTITAPWNEFQVSWVNQPSTDTSNKIIIPRSDSAYQAYRLDVTSMVQNMLNSPTATHGFYLKLLNESSYRRMVFASKESPYSHLAPILVVKQTIPPPPPPPTGNSIEISALQDAMIREYNQVGDSSNYGNYRWNNIQMMNLNGTLEKQRSLIQFDLSGIPATAPLDSAILELSMDRDLTAPLYTSGHIFSNGANSCIVRRIINPWQESTVNWFNQPSVAFQNTIYMASSVRAFQDYRLDVTNLVFDMLRYPSQNHGFYIQLQFESPDRRMVFASRENPDSTARPKLILYLPQGFELMEENSVFETAVYPNPSQGKLNVFIPAFSGGTYSIRFFNTMGQEITRRSLTDPNSKIDVQGELESGLHYYLILSSSGNKVGAGKVLIQ